MTAIDSTAITYDDLGNPLTYGTAAYTWQNGRQLASISMNYGAMVYSFEYNDSGIRTSKTVNGIEHVYTLNGSQIVTESWVQNNVEYYIVYLYDESGAPIGMQYRTSNYAWAEFDNFYFEKNLFGDVVAIYNETGTKIGSYKYDAWGACTVSVESTASTLEKKVVRTLNPFRYRGYYFDTETGFYYLQSRYYNPQWGRFLNADGYINANGDLIGFNMYAYCNNNPVMYVDPTGETVDDALKIWMSTMWWLHGADGPIPLGDLIYWGVAVVLSIIFLASIDGGDEHHIIHGSKGNHENGWKNFGIDPKKPDKDNWDKLLPIINEVLKEGEVIEEKIVQGGNKVIYYAKEFANAGKTVVVKVWENVQTGIQKISDAWPKN